MLAAKSNRGTDQGTPQALVCNSRLAVFSVAPIKLLECIFDEICNRLHPLLVGRRKCADGDRAGCCFIQSGLGVGLPDQREQERG